ncbi:MAG: sigma-70 family RNA polymerase sigma factor [Planctomycetaceae bacterium]|nr:sigma-70 family RNA polymerase sigma factor [Planctomycetaceae bacterium]
MSRLRSKSNTEEAPPQDPIDYGRLYGCEEWIMAIHHPPGNPKNPTWNRLFNHASQLVRKFRLKDGEDDLLQIAMEKLRKWESEDGIKERLSCGERSWENIAHTFIKMETLNLKKKQYCTATDRKHLPRESSGQEHYDSFPGATETPYIESVQRETRRIVYTILNQLAEQNWEQAIVFYLREYDDLSRGEITELTGLSPDQVRTREEQAKQYLQEELKDYLGFD